MQSLLDPCPMEIIGIFKNWKSPFPWKNNFCPNLGKKRPRMAPKWGFKFFEKFCQNENIYFFVIDISPPTPYLENFWFLSYGAKRCWQIKFQQSFKCNISRKQWMMNFIFGMQIDIKVLHKLILSSWVCIARYAQSTLNEKFAYFCIISRKMWGWSWFFVCR